MTEAAFTVAAASFMAGSVAATGYRQLSGWRRRPVPLSESTHSNFRQSFATYQGFEFPFMLQCSHRMKEIDLRISIHFRIFDNNR